MAAKDPPLDEIQWRSDEAARFMGGIHENTVLHYFAESPFFDYISNNRALVTQAANPAMRHVLETREAFETALRRLSGLEYVVAYGPKDFGPEAYIGEGRWVIRKQNRQKRPGQEDEVEILATYYVIGENIYMASSIGNILWSKMLSTAESLNDFFSLAATMPLYTPALGHHYIQPGTKSKEVSTQGESVLPSRAGTPVPGDDSQMTGTTEGAKSIATGMTTAADTQALYESFAQFMRYGNEYMDENELLGEPGSFSFATKQPLKPPPRPIQNLKPGSEIRGKSTTPEPSTRGTPEPKAEPALVTKPTKEDRSPNGPPKPKRRKSKAPMSPLSPFASAPTPVATSPTSPAP